MRRDIHMPSMEEFGVGDWMVRFSRPDGGPTVATRICTLRQRTNPPAFAQKTFARSSNSNLLRSYAERRCAVAVGTLSLVNWAVSDDSSNVAGFRITFHARPVRSIIATTKYDASNSHQR